MNLTGLTIGNIYIVQRCIGDKEIGKLYRKNNPKKSYEPKYDCKCLLCGKLFTATGQSIKNRKNKNCGCSALQYDLENKKFGKLLVIKKLGLNKHNEILWACICECGNKVVKTSYALRKYKNPKCRECAIKEIGNKNRKYIIAYKSLHERYTNMKTRCYYQKCKSFKDYGGRGIIICDEWLGKNGYINFQKWALQNHFNPKLSLDRINTNGNYEPSNCRFVTYQIQSNNRTNNRVIKLNNETDTLANWSRKLNIKYDFLQRKLAKGLTLKEILDGFQ